MKLAWSVRTALAAILLMAIGSACSKGQNPGAASAPAESGGDSKSSAETRPATGPASSQAAGVVSLKDVRIDIAARNVVISARVGLTEGYLEFLLCGEGIGEDNKKHESILWTGARPSDVHAGLLMLGLSPGKPAETAAGDANKFIPPRGAELVIRLRWKDKDGSAREMDPAEWLAVADANRKEKPSLKRWIFLGSYMAPSGGYAADPSGQIIATVNRNEAVLDVPFASTGVNGEQLFEAATKAIPPAGTPVEVVIVPVEGAEKSPHARAFLEIDPLGEFTLDGRLLSHAELTEWAEAFVAVHSEAAVDVRAHGYALVEDVSMAKEALRLGGIREFYDAITLAGKPMPRTARQAMEDLKQWQRRFDNPKDYINDPSITAAEQLRLIKANAQELDRRKALLGEYEMHLRKALERYEASTRPASGSTE